MPKDGLKIDYNIQRELDDLNGKVRAIQRVLEVNTLTANGVRLSGNVELVAGPGIGISVDTGTNTITVRAI